MRTREGDLRQKRGEDKIDAQLEAEAIAKELSVIVDRVQMLRGALRTQIPAT